MYLNITIFSIIKKKQLHIKKKHHFFSNFLVTLKEPHVSPTFRSFGNRKEKEVEENVCLQLFFSQISSILVSCKCSDHSKWNLKR